MRRSMTAPCNVLLSGRGSVAAMETCSWSLVERPGGTCPCPAPPPKICLYCPMSLSPGFNANHPDTHTSTYGWVTPPPRVRTVTLVYATLKVGLTVPVTLELRGRTLLITSSVENREEFN